MDKGFKKAKRDVIVALESGDYLHVSRSSIDVKNLLATGDVSVQEVIDVIKKCKGTHHSCSPHHSAPSIEVHTLKTGTWYIKFYFIDPSAWFISVHR
jgi:hypothetical protein